MMSAVSGQQMDNSSNNNNVYSVISQKGKSVHFESTDMKVMFGKRRVMDFFKNNKYSFYTLYELQQNLNITPFICKRIIDELVSENKVEIVRTISRSHCYQIKGYKEMMYNIISFYNLNNKKE